MARLSEWFRKSTERLTEVLLGADLQSRLCAYIDLVCAQRSDGLLPTRFRIEVDQVLFDQKVEEYRSETGKDKDILEQELAKAARDHILGKGRTYKTYADTVTVRIEPHAMTKGVKITAEFPKEKALPTSLAANAEARKERPEDARLPTVAKPVAATFDGRSLATVVYAEKKPAALKTRVFEPGKGQASRPAASMETRVVRPAEREKAEAAPAKAPPETRVYEPPRKPQREPTEKAKAPPKGVETRVYEPRPEQKPVRAEEAVPSDELATVVEEADVQTSILYRLALLEPEPDGSYSETNSWMLEVNRAYTIGRSSTNDIVLAVGTISRKHAQLEVAADGTATLSDLGSSHGTFLNGNRVEQPTPVQIGDDIQLTQRGAAHLALRPVYQ